MTLALGIAFLVVQILSLVAFIIVLVKLFKQEGALKGIFGFFCGIYTFIWGWMKHKQLAMTKVMVLWSVLIVASMALPGILATSGAYEMLAYMNALNGGGPIKIDGKQRAKISLNRRAVRSANKFRGPVVKNKNGKQPAASHADWDRRAMALWQNGKYTKPHKAIDYWSRYMGKHQNSAEAYNNRGLAFYGLKQYDWAIKDYNQALKLDPAFTTAYNNRGNSHYAQAKYKLALADFNHSLQLNPGYASAYYNRGLVYYQLEDNSQACVDFQKACDLGNCDGLKWAVKKGLCK